MPRAGRATKTWTVFRFVLIVAVLFVSFSFVIHALFGRPLGVLQISEPVQSEGASHLTFPSLRSERAMSENQIRIDDTGNDDFVEEEDRPLTEAQIENIPPGEHPKVALMFLTKGAIHTEPVWRQFLENAGKLTIKTKVTRSPQVPFEERLPHGMHSPINGLEESRYPGYKIQHGLVPPSKYRSTDYPHVKRKLLNLENIQDEEGNNDRSGAKRSDQIVSISRRPVDGWTNSSNDGCLGEQELIKELTEFLLDDPRPGREIYDNQDYFSIYVHATAGFSFPSTSLFSGLEIPDPINVTNAFALHTLVMAEMKLIGAALKDKRNHKFVLLSESCIPVHPPEVVYAQIIFESKSRINACLNKDNFGRLELWRWKSKMETKSLKQKHWRKSQQWFILNRFHAELAYKDKHIKEVFKRYCWSYGRHICVSDEHFIATMLASYNLDDETDCLGEGTWTNWTEWGWHPKTFDPTEISPTLLRITMNRGWPVCDPLSARVTALRLFDVDDGNDPDVEFEEPCMEGRLDIMSAAWAARQAATGDDWTLRGGYVPLGYECPIFARKFPANGTAEILNATLSCSGTALGPWCSKWHRSSLTEVR